MKAFPQRNEGLILNLLLFNLASNYKHMRTGLEKAVTASEKQKKGTYEYRALEDAMAVIVFAAMALEAYINDFGSAHLGDEYYYTYLDRLDLLSKLIVLPRLATNLDFQKEITLLNKLDILITCRNKLVHHKTYAKAIDKKEQSKQDNRLAAFRNQIVVTAKDAMPLLHRYFELLHNHDMEDQWALQIFVFTTEGCY